MHPSDKEISIKNFNFQLQYVPVTDVNRKKNLLTIFAKWSASQFATAKNDPPKNSLSHNSKRNRGNNKQEEKENSESTEFYTENLVDSDAEGPTALKKSKLTGRDMKNEGEKRVEAERNIVGPTLEQKFDAKLQALESKIDAKFSELASLIRFQSQVPTIANIPPNISSQYTSFPAQNNQGSAYPNNSIYFYHTFRLEKQ